MKIVKKILLAAILFSGCSHNKGHNDDSGSSAVRLNAGLTATTKAIVNTGETFTASIAGWESSGSQVDFSTPKSWIVTQAITASESPETITLTPQPYYNTNNDVKTFIRAWHPVGTLQSDGIVDFGLRPDGTTDVIMSDIVTGSAKDNGAKALAFNHLLTQVKFKVICNDNFPSSTIINSIAVKNVQLPTGINLSQKGVVYVDIVSLNVPNIASNQLITTTLTSVGEPIMMKPFVGNTFKVDIQTSDTTYQDVLITINEDVNFKAGKAYTITLNFATDSTGISASAAVTPWSQGTGSAEIPII